MVSVASRCGDATFTAKKFRIQNFHSPGLVPKQTRETNLIFYKPLADRKGEIYTFPKLSAGKLT